MTEKDLVSRMFKEVADIDVVDVTPNKTDKKQANSGPPNLKNVPACFNCKNFKIPDRCCPKHKAFISPAMICDDFEAKYGLSEPIVGEDLYS